MSPATLEAPVRERPPQAVPSAPPRPRTVEPAGKEPSMFCVACLLGLWGLSFGIGYIWAAIRPSKED